MSIPTEDKWILVQWNSGDQNVLNVKYLAKCLEPGDWLHLGKSVTVGKATDGSTLVAKILGSSSNRAELEEDIQESLGEGSAQVPGPSSTRDDLNAYSPSASDWVPSAVDSSSEDWNEKENKATLSRSRRASKSRRKRRPTPTHRPKPVAPADLQQSILQNSHHSEELINQIEKLYGAEAGKVLRDINKLQGLLTLVLTSIRNGTYKFKEMDVIVRRVLAEVNDETPSPPNTESNESGRNEPGATERSDPDQTDRSDDNVLITNRHAVVDNNANANTGDDEWVPIGSGITKIHKDMYRTINWKSYTVATRTLLLAAFSRRVLATHSLTGKKSPAFSNKPAKMCLDPKMVSDIVIEISDRFKVKDNLVRSIITTKCADECKMLKMKLKKKAKNRENIPPPEDDDHDDTKPTDTQDTQPTQPKDIKPPK